MGRAFALAALVAAFFCVGAPVAAADIGWCGTGETDANRVPDAVAGPLVHVVYAYPSDGADGFATAASQIASDIAKVDAWWRAQDPARTPRFDLYPFPNCSDFGSLDIGVVKLSLASAQLAPDQTRFRLIANALPSFDPGVKTLVFYDGPVNDPSLCGTAAGSPDSGAGSIAVLFTRSSCMTTTDSRAAVVAHEMTHELGAPAPGSGFPHPCPGDDGHVCDANNDLMYPYLSYDTIDQLVLDVGRDDYYRHGQDWFDLANSRWLRHLDVPQQPLALTITGGGTVKSDVPGLVCTTTCTTQWDGGSTVVLDAAAATGQRFVGWKGSCAGQLCSLTLNVPTSVEAVFGPANVRLTVRVAGRGSVSGSGVACPGRCAATVSAGDPLTLRAKAAKGWRFQAWSGACRGSKLACSVTPQAAVTVQARFTRVR